MDIGVSMNLNDATAVNATKNLDGTLTAFNSLPFKFEGHCIGQAT